MRGEIEIIERNLLDGSVSVFKEENMILDVGIDGIWKRMVFEGQQHRLNTFFFGDDMGNGTIFNPDKADRTMDGDSQNVVHELDPALISFTYPNDNEVMMTTEINGEAFMNANFPNDVHMRYTSVTARLVNGVPLAYKRFPIRSLARFVNVTINWKFSIYNEENACD